MAFSSQTYTFLIQALVLLPIAVLEVSALNYASLKSGEDFELKWAYNNTANKLMFKMKCKGMGWCAVGFSNASMGDGRGMKDYDIAAGGVASNTPYLGDYWSTGMTPPKNETTENWDLKTATEADGYTNVEFSRDAMTGDTAYDVQFMNDTEVFVMWAYNSNMDANTAGGNLNNPHNMNTRGRIPGKHNLIVMAMTATPPPSTTESTTGSTPTTVNGASEAGSHFVAYAIIMALSACVLSF